MGGVCPQRRVQKEEHPCELKVTDNVYFASALFKIWMVFKCALDVAVIDMDHAMLRRFHKNVIRDYALGLHLRLNRGTGQRWIITRPLYFETDENCYDVADQKEQIHVCAFIDNYVRLDLQIYNNKNLFSKKCQQIRHWNASLRKQIPKEFGKHVLFVCKIENG